MNRKQTRFFYILSLNITDVEYFSIHFTCECINDSKTSQVTILKSILEKRYQDVPHTFAAQVDGSC
jgi:hypothetical protein